MIFDRFRKRAQKDAVTAGAAPDPADSAEFLTGDPAVDRRSLQLLLDTMAEVGSTIELDQLLVDLVDKSIEATRSERGFLLLLDEESSQDDPQVVVRVLRAGGGRDLPPEATYSTSVAKKVLTTGEPVVNTVQSSQDALDLGQSFYDLKLRAVMCVPLEARGRLSGAIYVDSKVERQEFTQRDLAFFAALAQQLAVSLENARLYNESLERVRLSKELELAQRIQEQLLPKPYGLPEGVDAQTWYQPAEAASGDTFDVIVGDDGSVSCLLGDVSGHGVASALIAHSAQAAIRSYLEVLTDPGEVVQRLNRRFAAGIEPGNFMSMIVARVFAEDGAYRLRYVNAGHGCSWIVRASGVEALATDHPALGVDPDHEYTSTNVPEFLQGDLLFLCSDGVTEARNAERDLLGEAPLLEILERSHGRSSEEVLADVKVLLLEHTNGEKLEDDVMLLALSLR